MINLHGFGDVHKTMDCINDCILGRCSFSLSIMDSISAIGGKFFLISLTSCNYQKSLTIWFNDLVSQYVIIYWIFGKYHIVQMTSTIWFSFSKQGQIDYATGEKAIKILRSHGFVVIIYVGQGKGIHRHPIAAWVTEYSLIWFSEGMNGAKLIAIGLLEEWTVCTLKPLV